MDILRGRGDMDIVRGGDLAGIRLGGPCLSASTPGWASMVFGSGARSSAPGLPRLPPVLSFGSGHGLDSRSHLRLRHQDPSMNTSIHSLTRATELLDGIRRNALASLVLPVPLSVFAILAVAHFDHL